MTDLSGGMMPDRDLALRKAINTVLAKTLAPLIPDMAELIEVGNRVCSEIIALFPSPQSAAIPASERYQHSKRGTFYDVIGQAGVQGSLFEGDPALVYRGDDGELWVRHHDEFHDGRFEQVAATPKASPPANMVKLTDVQSAALAKLSEDDLDRDDWLTFHGLERTPLMEVAGFTPNFGGHKKYRFTELGKDRAVLENGNSWYSAGQLEEIAAAPQSPPSESRP